MTTLTQSDSQASQLLSRRHDVRIETLIEKKDAQGEGEFRIWNLEFGIWNLEFGIWNLEFRIADCGFGIWIYNWRQFEIREIRNPKLKIRNPKSAIRNPKFQIPNSKFPFSAIPYFRFIR
jgi:hypothetical protein